MGFKFEILENEDKNTLVLSSDKEIYNTRVVFNDDSKSEQFPLVKQLFFLPFVKSITLDKHLILIEKLDFLDWKDVQEEVIDQIEKKLGKPVITSNQAQMWSCLRRAGIEDKISGFGKLFNHQLHI